MDIPSRAEERMKKAVETLRRDLAGIRAGRASPALLEKVTVECYGTSLPLSQVASISVPEPRMLLVQPWDRQVVPAVEKAIARSDLGLVPQVEGTVIRVVIPPLTEERRQELLRLLRKKAEEGRVAVRNIRREANEEIKGRQKEGELSEDQARRTMEAVQRLTDRYIEEIEALLRAKEEELSAI